MADRKACMPNILRAVGWITLKFDVVVLCVGPISDDLNNFWEKINRNHMNDGRHFVKNDRPKKASIGAIQTVIWIAFKLM